MVLLGKPNIKGKEKKEIIEKKENIEKKGNIENLENKDNIRGINLIALILTVIVMLILVAVTVTVAINGGLFITAKQTTDITQIEAEKEHLLSMALGAIGDHGEIEISKLDKTIKADGNFEGTGGTYTSKKSENTYKVDTNISITLIGKTEGGSGGEDLGDGNVTEGELPAYADAEFTDGLLAENAKFESDGYTAVVPKGFKIINGNRRNTINSRWISNPRCRRK